MSEAATAEIFSMASEIVDSSPANCSISSCVKEMRARSAKRAMGQGADDFLGTQGDQWDTQSDMFCALLGALTTVIFLARFHCRQLRRFGLITG